MLSSQCLHPEGVYSEGSNTLTRRDCRYGWRIGWMDGTQKRQHVNLNHRCNKGKPLNESSVAAKVYLSSKNNAWIKRLFSREQWVSLTPECFDETKNRVWGWIKDLSSHHLTYTYRFFSCSSYPGLRTMPRAGHRIRFCCGGAGLCLCLFFFF